jgi:hypothetical protein
MDACLKKGQIGTLFVWVGAPEVFFWGGVRGVQPNNRTCLSSKQPFLPPVWGVVLTACVVCHLSLTALKVVGILHMSRGDSKLPNTRLKRNEI